MFPHSLSCCCFILCCRASPTFSSIQANRPPDALGHKVVLLFLYSNCRPVIVYYICLLLPLRCGLILSRLSCRGFEFSLAGREGMWQPPIDDYLINVLAVTLRSNLCPLKIEPPNSFLVSHEKHLQCTSLQIKRNRTLFSAFSSAGKV